MEMNVAPLSCRAERLIHHHHQCHVASRGHCIALAAWPWWMAHLQRSTSELLESHRIWSVHWAWGRPGRCLQLGPGRRPTDKSVCLQSTMCAGRSLSRTVILTGYFTFLFGASTISTKYIRFDFVVCCPVPVHHGIYLLYTVVSLCVAGNGGLAAGAW